MLFGPELLNSHTVWSSKLIVEFEVILAIDIELQQTESRTSCQHPQEEAFPLVLDTGTDDLKKLIQPISNQSSNATVLSGPQPFRLMRSEQLEENGSK